MAKTDLSSFDPFFQPLTHLAPFPPPAPFAENDGKSQRYIYIAGFSLIAVLVIIAAATASKGEPAAAAADRRLD